MHLTWLVQIGEFTRTVAGSNNGAILAHESRNANNEPAFSMVKVSGAYPTTTYSPYSVISQFWALQLGLRSIFN